MAKTPTKSNSDQFAAGDFPRQAIKKPETALNTPRKTPKGKFTLPSRIPQTKSLNKIPIKKPSTTVVQPSFKCKKSLTMLEMLPRTKNAEFVADFTPKLEAVEHLVGSLKKKDAFHKFLIYKTFYQMIRVAWKKTRNEKDQLLVSKKALTMNLMKAKTQIHVVKSLYVIERKHNEVIRKAEIKSKEIIAKLQNEKEKSIKELDDIKRKEMSTELRMDQEMFRANSLEHRLEEKNEEISQVKQENLFIIKARQEMEKKFMKKLETYKEIITRNQEDIEKLQNIIEELEMKEIELEEYHCLSDHQQKIIETLTKTVEKLSPRNQMKDLLRKIWSFEVVPNKKIYFSLIFSAFLPILRQTF